MRWWKCDGHPIFRYRNQAFKFRPSTLCLMNAPIDPSRHPDAGVQSLLNTARRYCALINASGPDVAAWLGEIAVLLPHLHAAMTSVHRTVLHAQHDHPVDLDARFELFSHLRALLADRDGYFLEFDRAHDGADAMTGSLADDLTDIYCELKHGLDAFDANPERALETWFLGYEAHWGQHLVDAQRHLANLAAANRM